MFDPQIDEEMTARMMAQMQAAHGKPECTYSNTRLPQTFALPKRAENGPSEMEQQCKGYSFVHTPQINAGQIALDENDKPKTPMFHIPKVPKKDQIVHALTNKKKKKVTNKNRGTDIYTPYDTKSVLTPSGN